MKVLNLLATGGTGGIEVLCKNILLKADFENSICCLFDEGDIYDELKLEGKNIFSLKSENKDIRKIVDRLEKYCIEEKIDIVVVHHGGMKCDLVYIMLKKRLPNLKYVRYLHACFDQYSFGNDGGFFKRILIKSIMKKAFECSDLLIFISKAAKRSFESEFDIKNQKKVVIYNGIGQEFFYKSSFPKEYHNNINVIFVGRLSYVKGIDILIHAMSEVIKSYDSVQLTIVGEGNEKYNLLKLAKELKLEENIKFVGRQEDVIKWLDNSDIFVYPSICEEGFGISVVEAMARGCIPITFSKGGLVEIIVDGKNGFLVDNVGYIELANKIMYVIKLKNKYEIKCNAIETSKRFSFKEYIKLFEKYLKECMD